MLQQEKDQCTDTLRNHCAVSPHLLSNILKSSISFLQDLFGNTL